MSDPSAAFLAPAQAIEGPNGLEPMLGGKLREKAVWVDESACIGCRYCSHVATNTFVIEPDLGRSRAIRQDGDSLELVQEAIDTCPVNCIHWVNFEKLDELRLQLEALEMSTLGKQSSVRPRRHFPRSR
ncbi:MAG: ferredoxin [Prochlorococcus sp.]|nr:ferredoxin [Prochlorococcus sp.]MDP6192976.1 ferredoxin [Prochlorococcaceae cyanobacterium ETNP18_MAG_1]